MGSHFLASVIGCFKGVLLKKGLDVLTGTLKSYFIWSISIAGGRAFASPDSNNADPETPALRD